MNQHQASLSTVLGPAPDAGTASGPTSEPASGRRSVLPGTPALRVAYALAWVAIVVLVASTNASVHGYLLRLPRGSTFRGVTGVLLASYLALQLRLAWVRSRAGSLGADGAVARHRLLGVLGPWLLLLHVSGPGYAYQTALFALFLVNAAFALCHRRVGKLLGRDAYRSWLIVHALLSAALVPLVLFHAYVAFYY